MEKYSIGYTFNAFYATVFHSTLLLGDFYLIARD